MKKVIFELAKSKNRDILKICCASNRRAAGLIESFKEFSKIIRNGFANCKNAAILDNCHSPVFPGCDGADKRFEKRLNLSLKN